MKVKKPIVLHLPEAFAVQLDRCLHKQSPSWGYRIEYFHYIAHCITVRQIQSNSEGYVDIRVAELKRIIVWNIDKYVKYLIDYELLERDRYIVGEKAYHYRISAAYMRGMVKVPLQIGCELYKSMEKEYRKKRSNVSKMKPHLRRMWRLFMDLDMDYDGARKWIISLPDGAGKYSYMTSLEMMRNRNLRYFKRNRTNHRLDTNLTNMKKELREYISGDFMSIDLANSQPFLLSQLLYGINANMDNLRTYNQPNPGEGNEGIPLCSGGFVWDLEKWFGKQVFKDVSKIRNNYQFRGDYELMNFQVSCIDGTFYDDFLSRFQGDVLTRDEVKVMMFAVLFSRNEIYKNHRRIVPYQKNKEHFAKVFPFVSKVIEVLKQKDHAKLAILLQRMESNIFIDTICPQLVNEGIVPLTIHDSIIVEAGKANNALEVCMGVFKEGFGVIPTFHVEPLKKVDYCDGGGNPGSETCQQQILASREPRIGQGLPQEMALSQPRQSA